MVDGEATQEGVDKDETTARTEESSFPTGQETIKIFHQGLEICWPEFVWRQRQTKVGLRKGGNITAKDLGHLSGRVRRDMYGNEGRFAEVDRQTGGFGEAAKNGAKLPNGVYVALCQDESIVCILKN